MITDIAHGEADLDTLKASASLIPAAKITKVPKVVKAIGNVGKTGFKKGKEGDKTVWKRFTQEDKPKPDKNKGNQSKAGSKSGTTTSKPNQEEVSKSGQAKQTKAKNKGGRGSNLKWGNPKSKPTYGHTFAQHGQKQTSTQLTDRARSLDHQIGQWLDDQKAANFLADVAKKGEGVYDVELLTGIKGRSFLPDGTEVTTDMARVIVKSDGSIRTAFPYNSLFD